MNSEHVPSWVIPISILAVLYLVPALFKRRRDILEKNQGKVLTTVWHAHDSEKIRQFIAQNLQTLYGLSKKMRHASINTEDSYIQFMILPDTTDLYCEVQNSQSYTAAQKNLLLKLGFQPPGEDYKDSRTEGAPNYSINFTGSQENCISNASEVSLNILKSVLQPVENETIYIDIFEA